MLKQIDVHVEYMYTCIKTIKINKNLLKSIKTNHLPI